MIINRKIKRTIMERKSQYMGSLVLIILSCLLFTMFNLLSLNMSVLTSSFEDRYNQEDASFMIDKVINADDISHLQTKYDVTMEETKTFDYEISSGKTLRIFSKNVEINIPAIIEGDMPQQEEILIDPAYASANNINVGEYIKIKNIDFKISGFMSLPNYIYPLRMESDIMNDANNFGIGVINKIDMEKLDKGYIFYSIKFQDNGIDLKSEISSFKESLKDEGYFILDWMNISDNPRVTFVTAKLDGIDQVSTSIPVAIILLTCILTGIVMWRMLKMESVIIGSLYAMGYRKKDIRNHYIRYPLIISLIGGVLGTILGALTLKPMLSFMVSYFNIPVVNVDYSLTIMLISILLPIVFLVCSSYVVINKILKDSPLNLMRGVENKSKVGIIERKVKINKLKFKTKFKIREQLRSIPRSVFLLLGVIMATMLLIMGFAAKSSIDHLMKDAFEEAFKYNYHYVFNSIQQGEPPQGGEAFSEIPFTINNEKEVNFTVYGVESNSKYITFTDSLGNRLSSNQVMVTRPLADKLNLKPDDTIKIINRLDSKEYSITIDSIADTYVGEYLYMPIEQLNTMLGLPEESYMGVWSTDELNIPENKLMTVVTVDDMRNAFNSMTQPLQTAIGAISFMAFIMGLVVIYVVTSLIIEENKGNISLMKVMGYRKKEVYSLILNSSSFIVVLGYILGVPFLLLSLDALFKSVTKDMSITIPVTINYIYILAGFVIIYLTYEISKFLSRKKINKISMSESLKSTME